MNEEILTFTIFGHFIGDWALQNPWVADNKGKYWYVLFAHCMIWTGVISGILLFFDVFTIWKAVFLLIGHITIDKWKTMKPPTDWWYIYPDFMTDSIQMRYHKLLLNNGNI